MKGFKKCFKRALTIALSSAVMITSLPQWTFAQEPDDEADAVYEAVTNDTEDSEYYSPYTITVNCPEGIEVDYSKIKTLQQVMAGEDADYCLVNVGGELHVKNLAYLGDYDLGVPLKGSLSLAADKTIEISNITYDANKLEPHGQVGYDSSLGEGSVSFRYFGWYGFDGTISSMSVTLEVVDRPDSQAIKIDTSACKNTSAEFVEKDGNVVRDGKFFLGESGAYTYTIVSKKGYVPSAKYFYYNGGEEEYYEIAMPDPKINNSKDGFVYTLPGDTYFACNDIIKITEAPADRVTVNTSENTIAELEDGGIVLENGKWAVAGNFTYDIISKNGYIPNVKYYKGDEPGDTPSMPDPTLNDSRDGFVYTLESSPVDRIEVTENPVDWKIRLDRCGEFDEKTEFNPVVKQNGKTIEVSDENYYYTIEDPFNPIEITVDPGDGYKIKNVYNDGEEVPVSNNKVLINPDPLKWLTSTEPYIEFEMEKAASWGDVTDPAIQARFENDPSKVPEGMWLTFDNSVKLESDETNPLSIEVYTGNAITYDDKIKVYEGTKLLKKNTDYSISYQDNIDAMTEAKPHASFTITGEGEYTGSLTFIFTIRPASITEAVLKEETVTVTAGTGLGTIKPELTFNGKALTDKDFKIGYFEKYDKDGKKTGTVEEADIATYKAKASESYIAVIWGHNNFTGQLNKPVVKVTGSDIEPKEVLYMERATVTIPKQSYTGSKIDVAALFESGQAKVKLKNKVLKYNVDYRIVDSDDEYKSVGEHGVFIEGTENPDAEISYSGWVLGFFEITGTPASKVKVACLATTAEYTGSPITLSDLYLKDKTGYNAVTLYTVKDKKNIALSSDDYEVSTEGSAAVGKQMVTFTLKNGYSGTITKTINVKPYDLTKNSGSTKVTVTAADTAYSKAGAVTSVTVKRGTATLREGTDYTLSFKNNKKIAAKDAKKNPPTVVVTGKGNYKGKLNAAFTINKVKASDFFTLSIEDKDYKTKQSKGYFKVIPKIMSEGKTVSTGKGKDIEPVSKDAYKYFYDDANTAIDPKATNVPENRLIRVEVTVKCGPNSPYIGDNTSTGETRLVGYYRLISKNSNIKNATVTVVNDSALTYRGTSPLSIKAADLKVVPKGSKNPLKSDTDYVIESVTDNRSKGNAIIVVKGTGNYGGRKTIKVKLKAGT